MQATHSVVRRQDRSLHDRRRTTSRPDITLTRNLRGRRRSRCISASLAAWSLDRAFGFLLPAAIVSHYRKRKKPTWRNTLRRSTTSAYSSTIPPASPSCSSSSHPTAIHCKARNGECNSPRLVKRELNKSEKITWETEACSAGTCRLHHSKCRNFSLASYWESHPLAKGRNALNRDSPTNLSDD